MVKVTIFVLSAFFFLFCSMLPGLRECYRPVARQPLLALMTCLLVAAFFLGSPRDVHQAGVVNWVRVVRIFVVVTVAVISAWIVYRKRPIASTINRGLKSLLLFSVAAMVSSLYSIFPLLSMWKGFEVFSFVMFGYMLSRHVDTVEQIEDILNLLWLVLLFLVFSAFFGIIIFNELAQVEMLSAGRMAFAYQGVFPSINANTLTQIAALLAALTLIKLFSHDEFFHKLNCFWVFLIAAFIMLLAHSRTSLFAFLISILVILYFLNKRKILAFSICALILLALSDFAVNVILPYVYRGQGAELFYSLSGRTVLWPLVWNALRDAPVLGRGFYTAHRLAWGVGTVDNTYLEVLLGLGVVGLVFLLGAIWDLSVNILGLFAGDGLQGRKYGLPLLVIYIFLMTRSMTGPSFQILHINLLFFVAISVLAHRLKYLDAAGEATG